MCDLKLFQCHNINCTKTNTPEKYPVNNFICLKNTPGENFVYDNQLNS